VHHPKQTSDRDDAQLKAEQEKQRRDQAIANATGLRVLSAIAAAVPVRLLKRDLFFVLEKLVGVLEEPRIETLARQHGIRQKREDGGITKTLLAFMRRADEGTLSRLVVEAAILIAASRHNGTNILKDAAILYKVDTEAIGQKVKQEFAAKARVKKEAKPELKPVAKAKKAA
jgi:ParB family chromosome partitioning protein